MPLVEPSQSLDPRAVTLWRLQGLVRFTLVGLPVATGAGLGLGSVAGQPFGIAVALVLVVVQATNALVWPALEWRHFRYEVRERDLLVQAGVLFRHWSSIPRDRIQHVDTRQGPLERTLGLARLQVFTAAGISADGSIPGLSQEEAERLRDELSQVVRDDGV